MKTQALWCTTISFSGVTTPPSSSHVAAYSSGVPHYTNNAKIHLHMLLQSQMQQVICICTVTIN